ncbi:glycosyltransferase family 2 protein [uncultured Modestobacter sp.]|uniref:glycosyltransferase family 2 protein n=1 Tax=uncultured Modestobacter sp. TaxID=380048 RepID=UPI002637D6CB|nr:glycosyltransferase [uncultured Modestobacter sp.]
MSGPPSLSLVLPVHRDGPELRRCLAAVDALDPAPVDVVVVVDGADPQVVERVRPHATEVIPLTTRGGPGRARNIGARSVRGEVLLFIDADVEVRPDLVARVAAHLGEHPEVDALIGSYDDSPGAPNFLSQYKNLLNHFVHHRSRREGFTFWGACGAIRRTAFTALGGFDEAYTEPSIEDIELGQRLRAAGGRIHVVPEIQVKHLKRWTATSLVRADVLSRALPWSELIVSRTGFDDDLNIDRAGRAKVAATGALLLGMVAARRRPGRRLAAASAGTLLALDVPLLRFYARHRGLPFAAATVPWLWLSYAYSGAVFGYVLLRHRLTTGRTSAD